MLSTLSCRALSLKAYNLKPKTTSRNKYTKAADRWVGTTECKEAFSIGHKYGCDIKRLGIVVNGAYLAQLCVQLGARSCRDTKAPMVSFKHESSHPR